MSTLSLYPNATVLAGDGKLMVKNGEKVHVLRGDGLRTVVGSLLKQAKDGAIPAPPTESEAWAKLVTLLEMSGLVTREPGMLDARPAIRMLWQRSGGAHPLATMEEALSMACVPVLGDHPLAERIVSILEENDVRVVSDPAQAQASSTIEGSVAPAVVVARSPEDALLREHNRWALAHGTPWLPVVLDDAGRSTVGPYVQPGSSACLKCHLLRRAANFPDRRVTGLLSTAQSVAAPTPATDLLGLGWFVAALAAEKVLEKVSLGSHSTMSCPGGLTVLERSHPGISVTEHRVLRVPRCPECSPTAGLGLPQVWHHGEADA